MAGKLVLVVVAAMAALAMVAGAQGEASSAPSTLVVGKQSASCPEPGVLAHSRRDSRRGGRATRSRSARARTPKGRETPGTSVLTISKDLTLRGAGADQVTIEPRQVGDNRIAADDPDLRDGRGVIIAVVGNKTDPVTVNISGVTVDANGVDATAGIVYIDGAGHDQPLARHRARRRTRARTATPSPAASATGRSASASPTSRACQADPGEAEADRDAHADDRPHARRPLQLDRNPDRRRDRRLFADPDLAAHGLRRSEPRRPDRRRDRRPQLVPPLQRLHRGRPDRPRCRPADRRRLPAVGQRRHRRPPAAAALRRAGLRPGRRARDRRCLGPDDGHHDLLEPRARRERADRHRPRADAEQRPVPAGQPRREQPEPASRRGRPPRRRRRVVGHAEQHDRQRVRRPQHDAQRARQQHGDARRRAEQLLGAPRRLELGADPAADAGAGGLAEHGDPWQHVQPADPGEPGQRRRRSRTRAVRRASWTRTPSRSARIARAPSRTRSAASGRSREAPIAQTDPPNCTSGAVQLDPNIPTYDSFFGTVLGGPLDRRRPLGRDPVREEDRAAVGVHAGGRQRREREPGHDRAARRGEALPVGHERPRRAVLRDGRRDARQHRQPRRRPQRRRVLARRDRGHDVAEPPRSPRSTPGPRFGWITGTPHGNEPAGGEGSTKELYELVARTDCANSQRLNNLDVFIQPVTAPDDRDHNVRTTGVGPRPEPGPRRRGDAGEPGAADLHRDLPGALLHRRAPAVVGLLLPAQRGRGAERDLALRARPDQRRDRAGHPAVVQRPERPVPQLQHLRPVRPRVRRHGARR